jgi:hypothetical protein
MTISDDLFRAVLAMDAYNRGYGAGINDLGGVGTGIGLATVGNDSSFLLASGVDSAAGFYALTYTWNSHQIISYRGTDSLGIDLLTGGLAAIGAPGLSQPKLAAQFYQSVINNPTVSPYNSTVEFTGHSLGGGLAGFMGGLYGKRATIFDNMPFEDLTINAHLLTPDPINPSLYPTYYFNGATPSPLNFSQISGYYVGGEVLSNFRSGQITPVQPA